MNSRVIRYSVLGLLIGGLALAEAIPSSLTDFTSGTTISSSEVNSNFDAVETAVDDNAADIDVLWARYYDTMDPAYQSGTNTYGLAEAVTACEASEDGGVVLVHNDGPQTVNMATADAIPDLTKCSVMGFGARGISDTSPYVEGASVYLFTNTDGKVPFRIRGNDLFLRNFGISMAGMGSTSEAVSVGDGTTALSGFTLEGMIISGFTRGPSAAGSGVIIDDTYKGEIVRSEIKRFNEAVVLTGNSQENTVRDSSLRESVRGLEFDASLQGGVFTASGNTYEGNISQVHASAGADVAMNDHSGFYEVSGSVGGSASSMAGILNESTGFVYHGTGTRFVASSTTIYDAGRDFYQSVTHSNSTGAHSCSGCSWYRGGNLPTSNVNDFLVTASRGIQSSATFTFGFTGNHVVASFDCLASVDLADGLFRGDKCIEGFGASQVVYECSDPNGVTSNGWCDDGDEYTVANHVDESLGFTWTGAHDFSAGTLEVPQLADCSSETGLGIICVETGDGGVFMGDGATANEMGTGSAHSNGSNCSAGSYPLGVDADGAVESCTDATTEIDSVVATKSAATSTDNAIARFDSTSGDVQNSGVTIDDSNNVTVPGDLTLSGSGASCAMYRDTDDAGYTECFWLNGTQSCTTDADGICDGS